MTWKTLFAFFAFFWHYSDTLILLVQELLRLFKGDKEKVNTCLHCFCLVAAQHPDTKEEPAAESPPES